MTRQDVGKFRPEQALRCARGRQDRCAPPAALAYGRLWVYVRDERSFAGGRPPAALFRYSADRKGEHPRAHLDGFTGVVHADGYAGFNELFAGNRIVEAGCWAHVRRKFFDVHAATASPIAKEALDRIGQLYGVEETIKSFAPDHRRRERQQRSKPIAAALAQWADDTVRKLSRKSELAAAFRYMRARAASPSAAVLMTAAWHSTTTRPSAPCAVSQSAAKMISLSAPMPAATVPLRCTR